MHMVESVLCVLPHQAHGLSWQKNKQRLIKAGFGHRWQLTGFKLKQNPHANGAKRMQMTMDREREKRKKKMWAESCVKRVLITYFEMHSQAHSTVFNLPIVAWAQ